MPFLAGGHALSFPAKLAISNASFILMMWELTDEEEGWADTMEDIGAIGQFAGTVYVLWVPPVVQANIAARVGIIFAPIAIPAAIITSMVIIGGVVSYAIDPKDGLKNYKEFISQPGKYWERTKFTAQTLAEEIIKPKLEELELFLNVVEQLTRPYRIRWKTGPYLPF